MTVSDGRSLALLNLAIDRKADETLGAQLYRQLRDDILSGRIPGGSRLPSTRRLCADIGVSRTVALAAYDQLAAEGYLEPRRGSGQFVCDIGDRQASRPSAREAPTPPKQGGRSVAALPFDIYAGAAGQFPHREWGRLLGRSWRTGGERLTGAVDWAGLPELRTAVCGHLHALKGIECAADEVVITTGIGDALQLIARALSTTSGVRQAVWVEDPGHLTSRQLLDREGLAVFPVPVDQEGFDVKTAIRLAPDARLALVTPSRQFPLGMPMSLARRLALLAWADEHGALILEDEYDTEIRFSSRPLRSLFSIGRYGSVCSIGSFSKLTFPGLRLGYVVAARPLVERMIAAREASGASVSTAAQAGLAAFVETGGFSRHLHHLRRMLSRRRDALISALQRSLAGDLVVQPQEAGMHLTVTFTVRLESMITDVELARRALARGLQLNPLSSNALSTAAAQGLLLGYGAWEPEILDRSVLSLAALIQDARAASRSH